MGTIKVTAAQLKWARTFRQLTIRQAAKILKISLEELQSYENAQALPSISMLKAMSKKYIIPMSTLVLPNKPIHIPKDPEDFRTLEGRPPGLSKDTLGLISKIRFYQEQLATLLDEDPDFEAPKIRKLEMRGNPIQIGEKVRFDLGISVDNQIHWGNADEAFRQWRSLIESQGIYVYVEKYDKQDSLGICLMEHPELPAIIINKSLDFSVSKIFTLVHEFAHVLIRKPGLSDQNNRNQIESFCNRFAAGFLIPESALRKLITPWPTTALEWGHEEVRRIAQILSVSQQSTALRLEELGLAPFGYYNRFKEQQPKAKALEKKSGFPPIAVRRIFALGRRFSSAIISASDRGLISQVNAASILNAPIEKFPDFRKRLNII